MRTRCKSIIYGVERIYAEWFIHCNLFVCCFYLVRCIFLLANVFFFVEIKINKKIHHLFWLKVDFLNCKQFTRQMEMPCINTKTNHTRNCAKRKMNRKLIESIVLTSNLDDPNSWNDENPYHNRRIFKLGFFFRQRKNNHHMLNMRAAWLL